MDNGIGRKTRRRVKAKRIGPPTQRDKEMAARKLQSLFRTRLARRRMRLLLRSVFEKVYDEETGAYFFHNTHTGDTSWEAPKLLGDEDFETINDRFVSPHQLVTTYRNLAKEWETLVDDASGEYYYFNSFTEETTWIKPEVVSKLEKALIERDEMLGENWEELQDESYAYYYHNKETGDVQWEPPDVDFRMSKAEKARLAKLEKEKQKLLEEVDMEEKEKTLEDSDSKENKNSDDSSDDSDSDSEPPRALVVDEEGKVKINPYDTATNDDNKSETSGGFSSDSHSIYISSEEEEEEEEEDEGNEKEKKKHSKKYLKKLQARKDKHKRQKIRHLERLTKMNNNERERQQYLAKVRLKRCRKRKQKSIDLSDMKLTEIPQEIVGTIVFGTLLENINLAYNEISSIPLSIKSLRNNLKILNLASNQLIDIPVQIFFCLQLEDLDLRNNRITALPREKGNMETLREIDLWEIGIETLVNLKHLKLDRNRLSILPEELGGLVNLESLSARGNNISQLPSEESFGKLKKLQLLDLSENGLSSIPGVCFTNMEHLKHLCIAQNQITRLPYEISSLKSLQTFDVSFNYLTTLPDTLGTLPQLELVKANDNEIDSLPVEWNPTSRIKVLNLSNNKLRKLPSTLGNLKNMCHLNLANNKLSSNIPVGISEMKNLCTLNCSKNELSNIDGVHFEKLTNLTRVDLHENRLSRIPSSLLYQTPSLVTLDISKNRLNELPSSTTSTKDGKLNKFDVSGNEILHIPEEFLNFHQHSLQMLHLQNNHISNFAENFHICENLERVNLDFNFLSTVPDTIVQLKKLRFISLNHNKFTQTPKILQKVKSLNSWQLNFNPIEYATTLDDEIREMFQQADMCLSKLETEKGIKILDQIYDKIIENQTTDLENCAVAETAEQKQQLQFLETCLGTRGAAYLTLEDFVRASEDITKALKMNDFPSSKLYFNRGVARYYGLNDPVGALDDFEMVLKCHPNFIPALRERSICLIFIGHYDKALEDAERALEYDMFSERANFHKALALEKLGKYEQALEAYGKVFQLFNNKKDHDEENSFDINKNNNNEIMKKKKKKKKTKMISPWSAVGVSHYRCGLILRDLNKETLAVAEFQAAEDILYVQCDKATPKSVRRKQLAEQLYLTIMSRASVLQTKRSTKHAVAAYNEAQQVKTRYN